MTEPMAIPPSAECTRSMFLPAFAQCPSRGLKFLQMMTCSSTTDRCTSAKPTSSPRSSPRKQTTMLPSCSLTLRTDESSIATVHILVQAHWRRLSMTSTHTALSESGTFTPTAAEMQEHFLGVLVERRLGITTSLATFFLLGRSTVL